MMIAAALPLAASAITAIGSSSTVAQAGKSAASAVGASDAFSSMLASFTQSTAGTMTNAEQMSVAGIQGKASTQSVVEAVMAAQESLQTALAVRDKAVSAFQDISRMPI